MFLYRCASCGSDRVQIRDVNEGFSYGKAAVGTILFGTAGAVAGLAGKKTTKYYCPVCGQTLDYPMNATQAFHIDEALMHRTDPSYEGVLRALKSTYSGIDWNDPSSNNNHVNVVQTRVEINPNATTEALIERIVGFIDDGDWDNASHYCEYLLDKEPSNAEVYKYKILIEHQARDIYELGMRLDTAKESLSGGTYNKLLKYGGEDAEKWAEEISSIKMSFFHRRVEARRKERYADLVSKVNLSSSAETLKSVAQDLQEMAPYEEAESYAKKCYELIDQQNAKNNEDQYNAAVSVIDSNNDNVTEIKDALEKLEILGDYKDAKSILKNGYKKYDDVIKKNEKNKRIKILLCIISVLLVLIGIFAYYTISNNMKEKALMEAQLQKEEQMRTNYDEGVKLFKEGNYSEAYDKLNGSIGDHWSEYRDAAKMMSETLTDSSYYENIGDAYSFYNRMSVDNEVEKPIKDALCNNKYIQLYEKLIGTYVDDINDTITIKEDGKIGFTLGNALYTCGGELFFADMYIDYKNSSKYRYYLVDWEDNWDDLDKRFTLENSSHEWSFTYIRTE